MLNSFTMFTLIENDFRFCFCFVLLIAKFEFKHVTRKTNKLYSMALMFLISVKSYLHDLGGNSPLAGL